MGWMDDAYSFVQPWGQKLGGMAGGAYNWAKGVDPRMWMGAAGTGMGIASLIQNLLQNAAHSRQIERLQHKAIDPTALYNQMTPAVMRALNAQAGQQGWSPRGGQYAAATGEGLGRLWGDAYTQMANTRQMQLNALLGLPSMPFTGGLDAFGSAYGTVHGEQERTAQQAQQNALTQKWMEALTRMHGGNPGQPTGGPAASMGVTGVPSSTGEVGGGMPSIGPVGMGIPDYGYDQPTGWGSNPMSGVGQ